MSESLCIDGWLDRHTSQQLTIPLQLKFDIGNNDNNIRDLYCTMYPQADTSHTVQIYTYIQYTFNFFLNEIVDIAIRLYTQSIFKLLQSKE